MREDARGVDDVTRCDLLAARGDEAPDVPVLVKRGAVDARGEADLVVQPVLRGTVLRIGPQLGAGRVDARPVRTPLERVLVAERGDVDGDAGVCVPLPRPAERVARLDDPVVADPRLREADRHADAGEAGPDDEDLVVDRLAWGLDHPLPS
jgi:hypothetical protein